VAAMTDSNMTVDEMKKQFTFLEKEPYIKIGKFQKYEDVCDTLPDWIQSYFDVIP
jgi:hypothetical protein